MVLNKCVVPGCLVCALHSQIAQLIDLAHLCLHSASMLQQHAAKWFPTLSARDPLKTILFELGTPNLFDSVRRIKIVKIANLQLVDRLFSQCLPPL